MVILAVMAGGGRVTPVVAGGVVLDVLLLPEGRMLASTSNAFFCANDFSFQHHCCSDVEAYLKLSNKSNF